MATPDYRDVSYEVWQRMAAGWDRRRRWLWEASRPVGEWMVEALAPRPGQTILEIATGPGDTGFAAAAALGDSGRLIQTDFAPNMVDVARAEAQRLGLANIEHRVMDAERMDLGDDSVDGVLCRWGYMLMADPAAALGETRRVLRDGGRLAMSVWGTADDNPWASVPARAFLDHTGAPPPDPEAPGIFALADRERSRSLLEAAGFRVERMEDVVLEWRFESMDDYWAFLTDTAGAIAIAIEAMPEGDRDAFRTRVEEAAEQYRSNGGYDFRGVALNTLAT